MSKILWLVGGTALALAVFAILNGPDLETADGTDRLAAKVGGWGTKQRVGGAGGELGGKLKEFAGNVTGQRDVQAEGALDQAAGAVKNAAGQAAQAIGSTLHDLKKS